MHTLEPAPKVHAKKRFGQNFLVNPSACGQIVDSLEITKGDHVLEIGPGKGAPTGLLLEQAGQVTAVEPDRDCVDFLKEKYKYEKHFEIIQKDFCKLKIEDALQTKYWKAVGNLPYNMASPILFHLLENISYFRKFTLMFQYEVAQRIVAQSGSKIFGFLSIAAQVYTIPKIILRLSPGSFRPSPSVHSAVVCFAPRGDGLEAGLKDKKQFLKWAEIPFQHRRKKLLKQIQTTENCEKIKNVFEINHIPLDVRPEDVRVDQWVELYKQLS
jgi:16S rRNA (adenine1518-N6/adenine1519-N6)-dimethyltransferase